MSNRYRQNECPLDCKVFVGNLSPDAKRDELAEVFGRYGRLRNVWLATNPPGFAFVMFEESRDAQTAVRRLNDTMICGRYVTVEMSTGKTRRSDYRQRDYWDRDRDRSYRRHESSYRSDRYQSSGSRRRSRDHYPKHGRHSKSRSRSSSPQRQRASGGQGHQRVNSGHTLRYSSRSRSPSRD